MNEPLPFNEPPSFKDNADFIDAALIALAARSRRLGLARDCHHAQQGGPDDQPCRSALDRLADLTGQEVRLKVELDARLKAHRADPGARQLGLDRLTMTHDLGDDERTILLAAFCFALSEDLSNHTFDDVGSGFGGNGSVEFYCRLLEAVSTRERLRARRHFQPDGRLMKAGLITIDWMRNIDPQPEDLLWCRVRITQKGFDAMSGPTLVS